MATTRDAAGWPRRAPLFSPRDFFRAGGIVAAAGGKTLLRKRLFPPPGRVKSSLFCGYAPQVDLGAADLRRALGLPVAHAERVRDDARARLQVLHELGPQLEIQVGQQVERDHRGRADI